MNDLRGEFDFAHDDRRRAVLHDHARVIAATGDPDVPLTAAHAFRPPADMTPAQGLGLLAAMALVLLSGFASGPATDWLGVRGFGGVLLVIAVGAAVGLRGVSSGGVQPIGPVERIALLGTLAAAVATGSPSALMLLPALVHAAVAKMMFASLGEEVTIIEMGARISHPLAPDFIRPYCRQQTAIWGAMFGASAVVTAALALKGNAVAHRAWTGWQFWALLGAYSFVEFFWRKAWFRYFGRGPFDRLLARLFPPEHTERGRLSQAYLLRMREELARLAEIERAKSR
jgi:uncharacterized membrane protein